MHRFRRDPAELFPTAVNLEPPPTDEPVPHRLQHRARDKRCRPRPCDLVAGAAWSTPATRYSAVVQTVSCGITSNDGRSGAATHALDVART